MRRLLAAAVFGVGTVGAIGCAGNATYVKKFPDGGVIALKAGGDQAEVRKMIEKHVGPDFDIETIQPDLQQANFDPAKPMQSKAAPGEMHYVYKKKAKADVTGLPAAPGAGTPGAGMPVGGGVGQAGFQQPGAALPLGTAGVPAGTSGFGTIGGGMQPPDVFPRTK